MAQKSIMVTGGAGFIGSHVVDILLKRGDRVVCVDDFNDYYPHQRKELNVKPFLSNPDFVLAKSEFGNREVVEKLLDDNSCSTIIHLAARAGVRASMDDPWIYSRVNVHDTVTLLELARARNMRNFVFASSSSVYGSNKKMPFKETDKIGTPMSVYAATKHAGELLCHSYHHNYGLKASCLRFFTVYGPGGRPDMVIYKFVKSILEDKPITVFGDGATSRDYTFVDDLAKGVVAAADRPFKYKIFNLGNNKPVLMNELIAIIEKHLGKKAVIQRAPLPKADVPATYADITRAKKLLGFEPSIGIDEGVRRFVEWYREFSAANPSLV
jgi:UDP-glucuronate 4-epimerase